MTPITSHLHNSVNMVGDPLTVEEEKLIISGCEQLFALNLQISGGRELYFPIGGE